MSSPNRHAAAVCVDPPPDDMLEPRRPRVPPRAGRITRRACLGTLAASWLTLPAAAATPRSGLWMTIFAGRSGGPVYWHTRGIEFVVVDGVATPVKGRVGVIAAVWRPRADGRFRVSYLLQGCNTTPVDFEIVPKLVHPVTGEAIPTVVTTPLKLGWNFAADGTVTEDLVAGNGTRAIYAGRTWESPGAGSERSATLQMNIRLERPNGKVETFSEVSVSRPRAPLAAPGADGSPDTPSFVAADSETFTMRDVADKSAYTGSSVVGMSMSHASNHASVDDLRRALRPAEAAALDGFFAQQAEWVRSA